MKKDIIIKLTNEEALVLFEYIVRLNKNIGNNLVEYKSEQKIIWDLECVLEKELSNIFSFDYEKELEIAREKLIKE